MKMTSVVLLISLVHLLLAFSSSTTAQVVVYDVEGEILRSETKYFVVPAQHGSGGGVRRGPTIDANASCPSHVVQSLTQGDHGVAVFFKPLVTEEVEINNSTFLKIDFDLHNEPNCTNNTLWKVEDSEKPGDPQFLSTNGEAGELFKIWFRIEEANAYSYKLVHCFLFIDCHDIGISTIDEGERRLAWNITNTFEVVFVKDTQLLGGLNPII